MSDLLQKKIEDHPHENTTDGHSTHVFAFFPTSAELPKISVKRRKNIFNH